MLQRGEHSAYLLLVLGRAVKLFGRWRGTESGTEKCQESLNLFPTLLPPQFIDCPSNRGAIKPPRRIRMLCLRIAQELPEDIRGKLFSTSGIVDHPDDNPGNAGVIQVEELPGVRTSGRGNDFRERLAFRVHIHKTPEASGM